MMMPPAIRKACTLIPKKDNNPFPMKTIKINITNTEMPVLMAIFLFSAKVEGLLKARKIGIAPIGFVITNRDTANLTASETTIYMILLKAYLPK